MVGTALGDAGVQLRGRRSAQSLQEKRMDVLLGHTLPLTTHLTPLITHHSTHHTPLITHHSSHITHHTPLISHHSSHTHTPLITHHSCHTTHHTPLITHTHTTHHTPLITHTHTHHTPLITHHSSYTTHHTLLTTHHSSYATHHTTHHTPLITRHSSYTTHHTPLITHHSSHTTHLMHFNHLVSSVLFPYQSLLLVDSSYKLNMWGYPVLFFSQSPHVPRSGQERFASLVSAYFRGCHGVVLVFDLSKRNSFERVQPWLERAKEHAQEAGTSRPAQQETAVSDRDVDEGGVRTGTPQEFQLKPMKGVLTTTSVCLTTIPRLLLLNHIFRGTSITTTIYIFCVCYLVRLTGVFAASLRLFYGLSILVYLLIDLLGGQLDLVFASAARRPLQKNVLCYSTTCWIA